MNPRQFFAFWLSLTIAVIACSGLFFLEKSRLTSKGEDWGLRWSRQWSTQIESLIQIGDELGKKDSLKWALREFRQTNVSADQKVYLAKVPKIDGLQNEDYRFDYWNGQFDYFKVIDSNQDQGFRILLKFPYQGFLGASSPALNLVYLGVVFLVVMGFSFLFTIRVPKYEPPREKFKNDIREWSTNAQATLLDFSKSLTDLKKQLDSMADTYAHADNTFEEASHGILPISHRFKEIALSLRGLSVGFLRIKKVSNRFKKEALGFGEDGKILAGTAQEMNSEFQRLMVENKKIQANLVFLLKEATKWQKSFEVIKAHSPQTNQITEDIQKDLKRVSKDLYQQANDLKKLGHIVRNAN